MVETKRKLDLTVYTAKYIDMTDADQKALNALAKGAGVTAVGMMVSKVLTYLYRVSIARFVGPEAYGQLSLALMVTGIASTIAYLAMGQGLQKFIPEFRTRDDMASIKGMVLSALHMTLPVSILLWAITFFGAEYIATTFFQNTAIIPLIKIISFTIVTGSLARTFFDTTIGFNKIIYKTGTVRILQNVVQLGVTVGLLLFGFNVVSAAWGWLTGSLVSLVLGYYFLEKKVGPVITSNVTPQYHRKRLLKFSSPLLLSGIIGTMMGWADTAFLGYYMTDLQVGLYNAALPTAMLILLPHKAIGSLALSSFSELKERDRESIEASMQTATKWVFSIVFPTFLLLTFYNDKVLKILFGSVYTRASLAMSILAAGYLVSASIGRTGSFLQSEGYTRYFLYNSSIMLILNIVLNYTLIPRYGIVGAAIATSATTMLGGILSILEIWKEERIITLSKKSPHIIFTSLASLIILYSLDKILFTETPYWFILPAGVIYFSIYGIMYMRITGINKKEEEILRKNSKEFKTIIKSLTQKQT